MESLRDSETTGDLSPLAWVQEELRRALEAAHKAVRRFAREAEASRDSDVAAVDVSVLSGARQQLHQAAGALQMVGEPAGAAVVHAAEAAIQRLAGKAAPPAAAVAEGLERSSFALLEYISRRLAGKPVSPVAMFPQYRTLQTLAGAERMHPADLWGEPWRWHELPAEAGVAPRAVDGESRAELESALLELMRHAQPATALRLAELFAALAAGASDPKAAALWRLSSGLYDGQGHGLLEVDNYTKRIGSRLLAQLRAAERGPLGDDAERLAHDLLFFCAQCASPGDGRQAPRLAAVRQGYELARHEPVNYEQSRLGRFDPAWLVQARKRVAAAKDAWSSVTGGEMHRLAGLNEQCALVGESLRKLYPSGDMLADELGLAISRTVQQAAAPAPELAMEVATSVLYLEASLEDGDLDDPQLGPRIQRLAARVASVRMGAQSEPLEPWMEELYRRVSDRQTMGSVVQELRHSLGEVERHIDQYFRDPSDRAPLIPVPAELGAMRGVLSVLGLDEASAAVQRMRGELDELVSTELDPARARYGALFDRLAGNLGALGFLIDLLAVQPKLAKSLFAFDAQSGVFGPVMGRTAGPGWTAGELPGVVMPPEPRLVEQAQALAVRAADESVAAEEVARDLDLLSHEAGLAEQPELAASVAEAREALEQAQDPVAEAAAREQLAHSIEAFVHTASEAADLLPLAPVPTPDEALPAAVPAVVPAVVPVVASGLEEDDEMREVFLEEAREVVADARAALAQLQDHASDIAQLTTVRRAFHTLKGSSRMVGLADFGEAAWSCEQLYNLRLAEAPRADEPLLGFTNEALDYLAAWVDEIEARLPVSHVSGALRHAADALRLRGQRLPIAAPQAQDAVAPAAVAATPEPASALPEAPLGDALPEIPTPEVAIELPAAAEAALPSFDFSLDLGVPALDAAPPAAAPAPADEGFRFELDFGLGDATAPSVPMPFEAPPSAPAAPLEVFEPISLSPAAPAEAAPADEALPTIEMTEAAWAPEPLPALDTPLPVVDTPAVTGEATPAAVEPAELVFSFEAAAESFESAQAVESQAVPAPVEAEAPSVPDFMDTQVDLPDEAEPPFDAAALEALDVAVFFDDAAPVEAVAAAEPAEAPAAPLTAEAPTAEAGDETSELVKVVGSLRIGIPLFNIYLNEADELSRRLGVELAEWAHELHRPVGETAVALAHSLAGSSATVGFADLSTLARSLEHALSRSTAIGSGTPEEATLFGEVSDEVRRLLHQFAAGILKAPAPRLLEQLAAHEVSSTERLEAMQAAADAGEPTTGAGTLDAHDDTPVVATLDDEAIATGEALPSEETTTDAAQQVDAPALDATLPDDEPAPAEAPRAFSPSGSMPLGDAVGGLGRSELKPLEALRPEPVAAASPQVAEQALSDDEDLDAVDAVDAELFPIFDEEAHELLPQLSSRLHDWAARPGDAGGPAACMRTLHTLKGGARLAGAMRLGELAHRLEAAIERLTAQESLVPADIEPLLSRADVLASTHEALRRRMLNPGAAEAFESAALPVEALAAPPIPSEPSPDLAEAGAAFAAPAVEAFEAAPAEAPAEAPIEELAGAPVDAAAAPALAATAADPAVSAVAEPTAAAPAEIDWSRFSHEQQRVARAAERSAAPTVHSVVRVRTPLLDRLVNHAGEVSIARSRIEVEMAQLKSSLGDLTDNLDRLRSQLRDIELQAETQMSSRMEAAKAAATSFDPLEFDRFTRFQELTRMMAESVNDVATVQRTLQRTLEATEDDLAAQLRLTRELQDDLLRTRMVEFESIADRLYRVVRQAAKETGKQVRLDIVGGSIEVDRGVLDRMTAAFEHLLRNAVTHGIESPQARLAAGKDAGGTIVVALSHEGNEVGVEFRDDGQGLNLARIRERGIASGLVDAQAAPSDQDLANLIFAPGFTTAETVTELAGRGVGMDVVRSDVNAMGGRIETATTAGQGTSFRLVLPLTTAVTQVVLLRCDTTVVAVPATLVELVRRETNEQVAQAHDRGLYEYEGQVLPFFWLGALLEIGLPGPASGRMQSIVVVRSAQQRVVIHVDEVIGNQEVVVKNLGPQLSRLPGLAGMTLLASGTPTLIYNPVALATVYGAAARAAVLASQAQPAAAASVAQPEAPREPAAPLVLVVDDSLTVRRVTQRLLLREGYRVTVAKDGLEALERLAEETPDIVLSDIEMPRMDGFDLVRNLRGDARWRELPVIMITSRIAQKHRDHAASLGVDHYLGKPYGEEDLLALIRGYVGADAAA